MFTPRACQENSKGWRKVEEKKKKCEEPIFESETREETTAARVFVKLDVTFALPVVSE